MGKTCEQSTNSSGLASSASAAPSNQEQAQSLYFTYGHAHLEWEEFVAGFGAGLINVATTFPLHKLMFRQMLHNIQTSAAFNQLRKEGFTLLYRGVLPPLAQKTVASSIMFGTYNYYSNLLLTEAPKLNVQLAKSTGAALAGLNEALLSPLERLQTILQDKRYNRKLLNTGHAIRHIWTNHGWTEFYRGGSVIAIRNSGTNVIFFACRETAQKMLPRSTNLATKYFSDFISGGVLGATLSSAFYPLNVVKTRMQCTLGGSFESVPKVFRILYLERDRKIRNIYRGVHLNVIRSLISWGIINASYELIRSLIHHYQESNIIPKSRTSSIESDKELTEYLKKKTKS